MEKELSSDQEGIEKQEQMCVYILQLSNGEYYTEVTSDIKSKMKEHQDGENSYTKKLLPVKLRFFVSMTGRQKARKLVYRIRGKGIEFWLDGLVDYDLEYRY